MCQVPNTTRYSQAQLSPDKKIPRHSKAVSAVSAVSALAVSLLFAHHKQKWADPESCSPHETRKSVSQREHFSQKGKLKENPLVSKDSLKIL